MAFVLIYQVLLLSNSYFVCFVTCCEVKVTLFLSILLVECAFPSG